jgi:hypothetical protein
MSIVAVAIVLSFHLRKTASDMELRMAKPLGAIFWALSVSCLGVGIANYMSASPLVYCFPSSYSRSTVGFIPGCGCETDGPV